MEAKEEIRSRLNIEDVVGEYVQLKRAGRNFKGLSPFSQEKSASFMVSPEKHIWHDFSSGKGGDIFSFVMEVEGLDFKGAIELLARKAGVDLSQYRSTQGANLSRKKDRLYQALEIASKYYQHCLINSEFARDYVVKKRKLNKAVVQDFMIGYSPDHDKDLFLALKKRGFTEAELRDAGLAVTRRYGIGDMFRARMMVSLMDPQGRVVGFTARILKDEPNAPKYINTPQTLLYDKSRHVFGLHLAKEAIRQSDFVVIVEGNLDVISSHQVNVKNVVATAGTALTDSHLRTLSRFTQDVRLAFDADKAGVAATERAISIACNLGINLSIITLQGDAKDPDELIKQDVTLWQQAIDQPKDAVEWLLDIYATRFDLNSAEGKRRVTDQALSVVRAIDDPVLREHYVQKISERVKASVNALQAKLEKVEKPKKPELKTPVKPPQKVKPGQFVYQDHLLALATVHDEVRDILRKLEPTNFEGEERQRIAEYLINPGQSLQSDEISVKIQELELIAEAKYPQFSEEIYFIASDIAKKVKKEHKIQMRAQFKQAFTQAQSQEEQLKFSDLIKKLDKEIEALNR
ncbi:MAG TPA: DNA primase [Candidatus Saccharimonadales bacterium]|nr:DNA primase [Candidatus Saccharimonadales bacterium]